MSATPNEIDIKEALRQFAKNYFREQDAAGIKNAQLARVLGRHVGKTNGFSRPTMTEIKGDRQGVGPEMRRALAHELFGGSIDQLETAAVEWWAQNKERILAMQRGKYSTIEKLYPCRGDALDRLDGAVHPDAIAFVRQVRLTDRPDLDVGEWMRLGFAADDRIRLGVPVARLPLPPAATKKK